MAVPFYDPRSADLDPNYRVSQAPDGQPRPTGYYPERRWPANVPVEESPRFDELYARPSRREYLSEQHELVDQHPWVQVAATWTPELAGPRRDGRDDPLVSGVPQPTLRLAHLHYQRQQGDSVSRLMDAPGVKFPAAGSQDGASWTPFVNSRIAMAPYEPDENGQTPDSLQTLPPSPPHGWTQQPVMNTRAVLLQKARELQQQKHPKQDRLANSTYAGQSFGQRTAHVADTSGATMPGWRSRG